MFGWDNPPSSWPSSMVTSRCDVVQKIIRCRCDVFCFRLVYHQPGAQHAVADDWELKPAATEETPNICIRTTSLPSSIEIPSWLVVLTSPLQFGGGAGTPDSVEGPNVRYPVATLLNQSLLSRVRIYLLQNQEPSTPLICDKKKSCFLQNQGPHMWRHQKISLVE